jgi:hypothetical protein
MKRILLTVVLTAATSLPAAAQFGSGIVFDPTQAGNVAKQIQQGVQTYNMSIQQYNQMVQQYNQLKQMGTAPQSAFTQYSNSGSQSWVQYTPSANTYGNSQAFINAATTGNGAAAANQVASVPRTGQVSGYGSLSANGQQGLAATGATVDLGDAANATSLQTLGTVRANSQQREQDIQKLEAASHSIDPAQQTEEATLQRINQALLIQLRTQQETNEMMQAQAMQQIVSQKSQQDGLKSAMQAANGYSTTYNQSVSTAPLKTTGYTSH